MTAGAWENVADWFVELLIWGFALPVIMVVFAAALRRFFGRRW